MIFAENLIEQIRKQLGEDIAKKVYDIGLYASIYSLFVASIRRKTQKELDVELKMFLEKYPKHSEEYFYRHMRDCHADKFDVEMEHCGDYLDTDEVEYYLATNHTDMADDGAYPYAILATMPLTAVYPMCEVRNYRVFKFNGRGYEEILGDSENYSEEVKTLLEVFDHAPLTISNRIF